MILLLEHWKPVVGYEGLYEVSNTGRVYGLRAGIVIKQRHGSRCYETVVLSKDSQRKHSYLHLIVADAFLGQRPEGMEVIHIDGWRVNNRPSNLEHRSTQALSKEKADHRREYARLYYHENKDRMRVRNEERKDHISELRRQNYQRNKLRIKEQNDAYRKRNLDKLNERTRRKRVESPEFSKKERGWHLKRYTTSRRYRLRILASAAKYRSKAAGVHFDADCFDAVLADPPINCGCCGQALNYEGSRTPRSPSLDRIHNDFGYIIGNVAVICFRCNLLKKNGTEQEFEQILAYMRRVPKPAELETDSSSPKAFWRNYYSN